MNNGIGKQVVHILCVCAEIRYKRAGRGRKGKIFLIQIKQMKKKKCCTDFLYWTYCACAHAFDLGDHHHIEESLARLFFPSFTYTAPCNTRNRTKSKTTAKSGEATAIRSVKNKYTNSIYAIVVFWLRLIFCLWVCVCLFLFFLMEFSLLLWLREAIYSIVCVFLCLYFLSFCCRFVPLLFLYLVFWFVCFAHTKYYIYTHFFVLYKMAWTQWIGSSIFVRHIVHAHFHTEATALNIITNGNQIVFLFDFQMIVFEWTTGNLKPGERNANKFAQD